MAALFVLYQAWVTGLSLLSLVNAVGDWFALERPQRSRGQEPLPALSILIPARNEAAVIGECIRSLRSQQYPGPLEILILDDDSDDGTQTVACRAADNDERVRVIAGGPLLPGWKGKPNALRQLAPLANGALLLLTDADCVFTSPHTLVDAVRYRERIGADCLSLMPCFRCETFWEHLVLPLQYDVVFLTLPVRLIQTSANPTFAAANGAFLLLPRAVYHALGGHEPVKGELAEDLKFAQEVKRRGFRLAYADGSRLYRVRMYDGLSTLWMGLSRNLFPAMGGNLWVLLLFLVFHLETQVLPFVFVGAALRNGDRSLAAFYLPLFQAGIALGIRLAVTARFQQALWSALVLHPFGWLLTLVIAINSAYRIMSGRGLAWKRRLYRA